MKVSRALFRSPLFPFFCALLALLSGCATVTKPASPKTKPLPPTSVPVETETKAPPPPASPETAKPPITPAAAPTPVASESAPATNVPPATPIVRYATITGSQESSMLLDNFTAFVVTVDGKKIGAGRNGWNIPLEIETGRRILGVEFNRGVFFARGRLEIDAAANAHYELKYATDAELFGNNSYCNFWIIDARTGQTVSMLSKAKMEKMAEAPKPSLLP